MQRPPSLVFLAPLWLSSVTLGQTISAVVKEGDSVAGVGTVTIINNNLAVNNSSTWLVEADTNAATVEDGVILLNGTLFLRENAPIGPPPGALSSAGPISINSTGNIGWTATMRNLTPTTAGGVFFNTSIVLQTGSIATAPQFQSGTTYIALPTVRLNDNNQVLVMTTVREPAISSDLDAVVIVTVDGSGNPLSEAVVVKEGDTLPGAGPETVALIFKGPHDFGFNNSGIALFLVDMTGNTAIDGLLVRGNNSTVTVLAREGAPSPVSGRNYETLLSAAVSLNNVGDYVYTANLDGATTDDDILIRNGTTVIAREGHAPPGLAGFVLTSFGTGAVQIDDSGNVYWFGDWNDPDVSRDTGIFRNNQLIVQEGVTMIGGIMLEFISPGIHNITTSPNGQYMMFEGRLAGGIESAFLIDFAPTQQAPTPVCFGDGSGTLCPCGNSGSPGNGCANSDNPVGVNLAVMGTSTISNDTLVLTATGRPANAPGLFFQGTTEVNGGLGATFGDGLRCTAGTVVRLKVVVADPSGTAMYPKTGDPSISVRGIVSAAGLRLYQDWYRNAPMFCTSEAFNLSNAVKVTWLP